MREDTAPVATQTLSPELDLLTALFRGDPDAAVAAFAGSSSPRLDAPLVGRLDGLQAIARAAERWPAMFGADRIELVPRALTASSERSVSEVFVPLENDASGEFRLPVAVAGDLEADGSLRFARVYFCEKPLSGQLSQRPSSFPQDDPPISTPDDYPDVNGEYLACQIAGDIDGLMSKFGPPDAYLERGLDRLAGKDQIRTLYELVLVPGVPVRVVKDTGTYDGRTFVLEWSSARVPPVSGLAAYARDANGRIASIHMYDNSPWPCD